MARPLRIEFPGAWYHVMNRGADGCDVFRTDAQRLYFLSLLASTTERFNAEWHAYCLMGNHYHLLLRTPKGNLQRIMRQVNGIYTQYFNRCEGRDGPLFRGRYKAILVDGQAYWIQLSRYIHRNPLEAGLVEQLEYYPWSSYPAYIGISARPDWLVTEFVLRAIAPRHPQAQYRSYVEAGVDQGLRDFYAAKRRPPILGDDVFRENVLAGKSPTPDIPELRHACARPGAEAIVRSVAKYYGVDPATLWQPSKNKRAKNPARSMAMVLCQEVGAMRLREIAAQFGLKHYGSASSGIQQIKKRMAEDERLRALFDTLKRDLTP